MKLEVDDQALLTRLLDKDETAFELLIDRHYGLTVGVARSYVRSWEVAEEVAQEAWMAVIEGLDRFEGRSSLKHWIVRIVVNKARTRAVREARSLPFSTFASQEDGGAHSGRFSGPTAPFPARWTSSASSWRSHPEEATAMHETLAVVQQAIESLPDMQRLAITLHDIHGWSSAEIAEALGVTDKNERVLLHRARTKVRTALEKYFTDE